MSHLLGLRAYRRRDVKPRTDLPSTDLDAPSGLRLSNGHMLTFRELSAYKHMQISAHERANASPMERLLFQITRDPFYTEERCE